MTADNPYSASGIDQHQVAANSLTRQQAMVVVSMYVGYATFMVLRMFLTVASTSIITDPARGVSTGD